MKLILSVATIGTLLTQTLSTPTKPAETKAPECYAGGMEQYPPISGKNTPPCWYKQASGKYHCYEYKANTKECPWPGFENPKPGDEKPAECYAGGMEQFPPISGKNTPPCWYKQASGKYHCYDYKPSTKECPWPGFENPKPE
ncbi:hypothetical protein CONCODRAFT_19946 [Conidiobolus coronatus NRRL 28638]|uniref:Uncharacterized protein n=1 Tax=Conidiobolus coronatus (strain ATCC 28846 / CBS 209.66 / NRRL 28638) TaxID=796925 RepID=A0A137NWC1_CONC2|nr:hypothetical protein CONCODRAFT_19946 [Conidiobolus coronatus NRRL 28638]|eukprot:KXN66929.1 hypothetical protein CONCODRAFT_19946 [Conidiobolus coronatus NRRL 28638]